MLLPWRELLHGTEGRALLPDRQWEEELSAEVGLPVAASIHKGQGGGESRIAQWKLIGEILVTCSAEDTVRSKADRVEAPRLRGRNFPFQSSEDLLSFPKP
ncbi:hypothetical protein B5K11_35515 [Rhizobium leguminosarum bv. trifolii]|nr:hypothetical protein B5K11_35515 [Rhizobium leguminosarum bv. trifolii]